MSNKNQPEEEFVYDEEFEDSDSNTIAKLRKKLKKCVEEKQEYLDGWQRSKADFVNFKKRSEEDKKDFAKYALEDFVMEIIPALDSFDMAFKDEDAWNASPENWRKGIEYIHQQLLGALESRGIKQINPIGEDFDTNKHNSVGEADGEEGKIVAVTLKGYSLNDKIIRPPSVKVGNGK